MSSKRPPRNPGFNVRLRVETARAVEQILRTISLPDKHAFQECCITCLEFDEKTETCLKYNARPPARVIAFGCDQYTDVEEIPF